ncbi:MAG: folylpolyglutamate synthase/dihydrofolate synthase family protein [Planctomycetota bacterium]
MDYAAALAYLDTFVNFERQPLGAGMKAVITLDRVRELAARLGNPQDSFPSLHVAGTKGKGSTCAFAEAILSAAGLRAGLYTSPHLQDVRERIRINGAQIPPADFARLVAQATPALEAMRRPPPGQRRPTYFEALTHLAFAWFAEQQVDVAVVEVGMGGRLDATNILTPRACGITNISLDHQAILGSTLQLIAGEKAGIMKPGVPVVIAPQAREVARTLEECARAAGAPCEFIGRDMNLCASVSPSPCGRGQREWARWLPPHARLRLFEGLVFEAELGLRGKHQVENWAVAVRLADLFHKHSTGKHIPPEAVRNGSRNVYWPGRLEEVPAAQASSLRAVGPRLILDGAHNDHSLRTILNEVTQHLKTPAVLFACAKDKDSAAMLQVLAAAGVRTVVFTHSGSPRGRDPGELAQLWLGHTGSAAPAFSSCAEGFEAARGLVGADDVLLVTGSLYLVGAVKDLLQMKPHHAAGGV